MKKIILSSLLFLGVAANGFSQERVQKVQMSPVQRAEKMTAALDKKLSLTSDQKSKIYQINLDLAQSMSDHKQGKKDGIQHADKGERKAQFETSESRILNVLNESQKVTYAKLKADRQAKMKTHQGGRRKEGRNRKV